ncbi:MAG TPA: alkaline phosphatase family protein [Acetobacteraceae bacterium]|nr:alkaline phosphatase family protein [Acetobacteraceae bacterium]
MPSNLDLIDTIVFLVMENRSFDHMLGYLNLPGPSRMALEGLQADPAWLRQHANSGVEPFEFADGPVDDPPHEKATIAIQLGTPTTPGGPCPMDGFVDSYRMRTPPPRDERLVMGHYTASSVPIFDFLARNYTVCDHWFASLPTGTQANRLMAMSGATSITDNAPLFLPDQQLVYDWLTDHAVSWCAYQSGGFLPFFALMPRWQDEIATSLALDALVSHAHPRFRRFSNFARDWQTEQNMPAVIFIEPEYTDGPHIEPNDDHPPTGVAPGQALLRDVYLALISNPTRWARTLLVVSYDEHGGFYDHVPPLDIPTSLLNHGNTPVFVTTGVRVPALLVSPLVERGAVFSGMLDHTSFLQLIAGKFGQGFYSPAVANRQPALARLSDAITRATPRSEILTVPTLQPVVAAALPTQRAPGANANATAFQLAANKIAADHAGIVAGWPELKAAADR